MDLGVGIDDLRVSRRHGELTYRSGQWWLRNTGQQLVRLPRGRMMHLDARTAGSGVGGGRRGLAGHCSLRAAVIVCEVREAAQAARSPVIAQSLSMGCCPATRSTVSVV
ncbi:FHA domain-containing protein [Streptomyces sp. BBFR25]|uniref:FHA domain-containing protein n=1 Tax=Streptomyces sp. BBFR25 TaxID=3372855 RepID=UPI0037DD7A63